MVDESKDLIGFQGIGPKPPPSPDLAHYFKHSADYGSWQGLDKPKSKKKKAHKGGRRKRGKIRLFPDE